MLLQKIRDCAQGWVSWVFVFLMAALFIVWGLGDFFSVGPHAPAAKVNGTPITWHEVEAHYDRLVRSQEDAEHVNVQQLKKQALHSLIQSKILDQSAEKLGISISGDQLKKVIQSIPEFQENGKWSQERYLKTLKAAFYTEKTFEAELRQGLILSQLQQSIIQSEFSLPSELSSLISLADQHRDIGYLSIPLESFKKDIKVTPEEISAYYEAHLGAFKSKDRVQIQYLMLTLKDLLPKISFTPVELKQYYDDHLESFSDPEKVHAAHLLIAVPKNATPAVLAAAEKSVASVIERLKEKESFESLARDLSDDSATAEKGGDLRWFKRGDMTPEFEKAAFELQKDGDVSSPVRTEYGFHFIKRYEYAPAKVRSFEQVKSIVTTQLRQEKAALLLLEEADHLSALSFEHPDSLEPAAEKLGLTLSKTDWFDRNGAPEGLLAEPLIVKTAFSPEVLTEKHNSDLLELGAEKYLVLRLEAFQPSEQLVLNQVEDEVRNILISEKARTKAQEKAGKLMAAIRDRSGAQLATQEKFHWQVLENASRQSLGEEDEVIRYAFTLPRPAVDKSAVGVLELNNGDLAVVQVLGIKDGDIVSLSAEQQKLFRQGLAQSFGELSFGLYANHSFETAKIKQVE